ncbi:hypothetical protein BB558_000915 [Smittium angustum]|uniref:UNC-45/Cro1/She4 central domain-containing protein n=1 Tax=Smittium angustum TaxID=133377 RepID=A0A2U1JCT7_SMIAN|nr:hypothetical protein BB558_000915 [Smittium angustum]
MQVQTAKHLLNKIGDSNRDILDVETCATNLRNTANLAREESFRKELREENGLTVALCVLDKWIQLGKENIVSTDLEFIEQALRVINNCCVGDKDDSDNNLIEISSKGALTLSKISNVLINNLNKTSGIEETLKTPIRALVSVMLNATLLSKKNLEAFSQTEQSNDLMGKLIEIYTKKFLDEETQTETDEIWESIIDLVANYIENALEIDEDLYDRTYENCPEHVAIILDYIYKSAKTMEFGDTQENIFWSFYQSATKHIVHQNLAMKMLNTYESFLKESMQVPTTEENPDQNQSEILTAENNVKKPITYSKRAEAALRIIYRITSKDENLELLFNNEEILENAKFYLNWDKVKQFSMKDENHRMYTEGMAMAMLVILGNVACKDEYSIFYAKTEITKMIIDHWFDRNSDVDVRTCYAACGFVRNICVPDENKEVLVEMGILDTTVPWLISSIAPIQVKATGIFRHMMISKKNSSLKIKVAEFFLKKLNQDEISIYSNKNFTGDNCFEILAQFAHSSEMDPSRCESTRLLISVLGVLFIDFDPAMREKYIESIQKSDIVTLIVRLAVKDGKKHQILLLEGISCLSILTSSDIYGEYFAKKILDVLDYDFSVQDSTEDEPHVTNEPETLNKVLHKHLEHISMDKLSVKETDVQPEETKPDFRTQLGKQIIQLLILLSSKVDDTDNKIQKLLALSQ